MLIDTGKYISYLKNLWSDTFGDDREYISLLFDNGYTPAECFAEIADGEVVSVLYLLKGYIKSGSITYEGRYLYAAATAVKYRGKGLMSKLIKEAQEYVKENNISFISLVPAEEGLYGYYGRFGFEAVMKNYIATADGFNEVPGKKTYASADVLSLRNCISSPYFHFADEELKYAVSCLRYASYEFVKNSEDSYYIISGDGDEVLEYISTDGSFSENTKSLLRSLKKDTSVVSPYDLSSYCECKENNFGMVYFADKKMKENIKGNIYMNIALD